MRDELTNGLHRIVRRSTRAGLLKGFCFVCGDEFFTPWENFYGTVEVSTCVKHRAMDSKYKELLAFDYEDGEYSLQRHGVYKCGSCGHYFPRIYFVRAMRRCVDCAQDVAMFCNNCGYVRNDAVYHERSGQKANDVRCILYRTRRDRCSCGRIIFANRRRGSSAFKCTVCVPRTKCPACLCSFPIMDGLVSGPYLYCSEDCRDKRKSCYCKECGIGMPTGTRSYCSILCREKAKGIKRKLPVNTVRVGMRAFTKGVKDVLCQGV